MAIIKCTGCGLPYNDDPNLYVNEVHCPHCGLSADGTKHVDDETRKLYHYPMPSKPTLLALIPAMIFVVIATLFFFLAKYAYPYLGLSVALFFVLLGLANALIAIYLANVFFIDPLSKHSLYNSDYEAYRELIQQEQDKWAAESEKMQKQKEEAEAQKYNYYKYKCPMCGSNKIINISTMGKAVSAELWGLGSKKVGKCYQCEDCKYMW